jgi:hypothetical protein
VNDIEVDVAYDDWHADHDFMSKRLHVYGNCVVKGGGFAVGIEPHERQGFNPQMLMLGIRVTATGESPSHQAPEYWQDWNPDGIQYNEVGFELVGDVKAPVPQPLKIRDVH